MDIVKCGACGSGSEPHLIVKCARCGDDYEHCYCMKVVAWETPPEWYCSKCQEDTNGGPKSSQGGQKELQRETSKLHRRDSNVAYPISPKSLNRFGNPKVKHMPCEEAAVLLSRGRPPFVRSRLVMSQPSKASSPPTTKHLSNMNCLSPSKSDTKVQALKGCGDASHSRTKPDDRSYSAMQQRQVHPASPSSMKQPPSMKSISPGRNDMQVQNLKQSAAARHDQTQICDSPYFAMRESQLHPASPPHVKQFSNMKCISSNRTATQAYARKRSAAASHDQAKIKVKNDSLIEQKSRENKIVNADKGEINSQTERDTGDKGALYTADEDTAEVGNLNQNKDMVLVMGSTVEYSRRPAPSNCWTGCFHVSYSGEKLNHLGEFKAYFPSKVSPRVIDIVKIMPTDLQLEFLPRMNDWPKSFETNRPVHEDIGVFFFSNKPDGCNLLEASSNYVLRAYIDEIKLLIYSSEVLPPDSQWVDGKNYLWGLFVRPKGKCDPWRSGSTTTRFVFPGYGSKGI